jgi:hypothetical protein
MEPGTNDATDRSLPAGAPKLQTIPKSARRSRDAETGEGVHPLRAFLAEFWRKVQAFPDYLSWRKALRDGLKVLAAAEKELEDSQARAKEHAAEVERLRLELAHKDREIAKLTQIDPNQKCPSCGGYKGEIQWDAEQKLVIHTCELCGAVWGEKPVAPAESWAPRMPASVPRSRPVSLVPGAPEIVKAS